MNAAAPVCRWRVDKVAVDVMPTLEKILGFSNRWYPLAMATATPAALPSGLIIRLVHAPVFIGTKLEAFSGRGNGDYLFSHDLGDFLSIMDGRDALITECQQSDSELRAYLSDWATRLLAAPAFLEALPGHLLGDAASQQRLPDLKAKLHLLASLSRS